MIFFFQSWLEKKYHVNYGPEGRPSCYFKQLICFKACCRAELFREDQALLQEDKSLGLCQAGLMLSLLRIMRES